MKCHSKYSGESCSYRTLNVMKYLYLSSVLYSLLINSVVCQYQWACTEPNMNGQRYIPSERDRDVLTATTNGNELNIYRVPNLNSNCYGPVTAIEYCYRYRPSNGNGPVTFNWTVLILEDAGNNFVINSTHVIQSRHSAGSASCRNSEQDQVTCCDVTNIERFDLPMDFIFGVTESAQGNTHGATLLAYATALPQYRVNTVILNKAGLTLSVGSPIPSSPSVQRGLCMLWFVIGTANNEQPQTTMLTARTVTSIPITGLQETETTMATMIVTSIASNQVSVTLIGTAAGGVAGSLFILALVVLIIIIAVLQVWIKRKYKRAVSEFEAQYSLHHQQKLQLEGSKQREAAQQQQEHQGDEVMEMKTNDVYISNTRQIPTEDNVAYGQATPQISTEDNVAYSQATPQIPTEDNVAYGQATPQISIEDNVAYGQTTPQISTEDNVAYGQIETLLESDYNLLSDQCEYEYI